MSAMTSRHTTMRLTAAVGLLGLLVACAGEPSGEAGGPKGVNPNEADASSEASKPDPKAQKEPDAQPEPKDQDPRPKAQEKTGPSTEPLDFMDFVASHCLVDQLEYTEYAVGWIKWARRTRFRPKTGPMLTNGTQKKHPEGSEGAKRRAKALREAWRADPKSHVVDCSFKLERRKCTHCAGRGSTHGSFVAYLPAALTSNPERVRSILMLIPGGNGARTRYFLTPIPNKTIYDSMSGGLEVQRHTDEFIAANPDSTPPIVVAINGGGWLTVNGAFEYQTHDIPTKIAEIFLGDPDLSKLAIGADGISSGSRSMLRTYAHKPYAVNTIGLTCMHCGGKKGGFLMDEDFLVHNKDDRIFDAWRDMSNNGLLHFHFAIGNRDRYWTCNREIHDRLIKEKILKDDPPRYENCREGKKAPKYCDTSWDGFELYDGQGHHYGLLLDSWAPTLKWHFRALDKTVKAIDSGALTKVSGFER